MSGEWIREAGWWCRQDDKPTHLLLDGGKARVPDDSAGAFLSAYAIAVVKGARPCVVELRTPVFKLFLDLDVQTAGAAAVDAPAADALDFPAVMRVLQRVAERFFASDELPRAVVCATEPRALDTGNVKAGRHVVWTNVRVTSATALAYRAAVIEELDAALPGACAKPWDVVVDACVFKANGLRMPFSGKGRGNSSTYVPTEVWVGQEGVATDAPSGVSAVRDWVRQLSIRVFSHDETPLREGVVVADPHLEDSALHGVAQSLAAYAPVLPLLDAALPPEFAGQRFTGLIKTETCYLLRSSSQYCINLGRRHNSNNVFFVLTRKGIRQKCYCRCETTEGRAYGMCKDFGSDVWPVPDEALAAFFPDDPPAAAAAFKADPLPSRKTLAQLPPDELLMKSRPRPGCGRKRRR